MINKTCKMSKIHIENLLNDENDFYACVKCHKMFKNFDGIPEKCPFCDNVNIFKCDLKLLEIGETVNGTNSDKHS